MASAIVTPFHRAGLEVRLWGTHLDAEIVSLLRSGAPHPRTAGHLPDGESIFDHHHLADSLRGASIVAIAVASEGVKVVIEAAAPLMDGPEIVLLLSKGFGIRPGRTGRTSHRRRGAYPGLPWRDVARRGRWRPVQGQRGSCGDGLPLPYMPPGTSVSHER